jgi:hypothetical protein
MFLQYIPNLKHISRPFGYEKCNNFFTSRRIPKIKENEKGSCLSSFSIEPWINKKETIPLLKKERKGISLR